MTPPPGLEGLGLMLDGYFHEDFRAEHGSHEAAARAFVRDASPEEREAALSALDRFLAWAAGVPRRDWQDALGMAGEHGGHAASDRCARCARPSPARG